VDIEEFRALDVPVVLVQLVIEDVRVREVRVQRVDNLFGFLGVEPKRVLLDGVVGSPTTYNLSKFKYFRPT
jgi:hypothetical protein